jgi:hypothetical protein
MNDRVQAFLTGMRRIQQRHGVYFDNGGNIRDARTHMLVATGLTRDAATGRYAARPEFGYVGSAGRPSAMVRFVRELVAPLAELTERTGLAYDGWHLRSAAGRLACEWPHRHLAPRQDDALACSCGTG